ncbi:biotin-dependent carboxyltransferase family protein [Mariniflexile litorale]|uniref:Biotin-dependent carboxyltransferase family protein n=1 Tax=Mariniflexile litorale TaxID=3045158 RepID=A0AAU7EH86_9FLAO|nr:biotin-dependent carboxyltransferase family protein [Mariniflexile sp. KMM 9835]MDQ8211856.1 biotin-dependent carboxyltransferase family protein [Mariniflexile sp. KMM 9835]
MVKVLAPGLYSSIQDLGRIGFQKYGVPYSGAMDVYSAALANHILGNNENDAVIEMTMTGAKLQFNSQTCVCISGAAMSPRINNNTIKHNKNIKINVGDVLSFGKLSKGFRCYLAVSGGFKTEEVMGSRSMYLGVTDQFKLYKNDTLLINENNSYTGIKNASVKVNNRYFTTKEIDVFKGPEFEFLSENEQAFLFKKEFTISKDNNRMAYQLSEPLENSLKPIITSAVLPGTVQLTPSGKLIILMRDCQTTGGYPRVLQLKESAINILAQKFTGGLINFKL